MSELSEIEKGIENLLIQPPYSGEPKDRNTILLTLLKKELAYACDQNPGFRNYVDHWPEDFRMANRIADLPYLPVDVFKADPPLSWVGAKDVKRILKSSATTGQTPSQVTLDAATARRMTKGVTAIIRDFIGSERRPYLVIDTPENGIAQTELGARAAAIQGLRSFATETVCCLTASQETESSLDLEKLLACAAKWKHRNVLVYGFTYVIWTRLVEPLQLEGVTLDLPNAHVLHSGGWKRLEQKAVTRDLFSRGVASTLGCSEDRVLDYYGMVENVGVIYPDCRYGNKHVPIFADVIVRDALTLLPVAVGEQGLIQVCSVLPTSFPGFLLLTQDLGTVMAYDGCPCGRRGTSFRFAGRAPKAEVRGCGNLESTRYSRAREMRVA